MIKAETNKGLTDVTMEGATGEIASDLLVIVASVFNSLVKQKPEQRDLIKDFIKKHIANDTVFNTQEDSEADD